MKRLQELYKTEIVSKLKNELKYSNIFEVPKITKVSINIGVGKYKENPEKLNKIANDLYLITGQKPHACKSRKAISGFKLRAGEIVGLHVTLRGKKMYEFLEKLLQVALPRVRDFRGLPAKSFDQSSNYSMGIKEHVVFPEITYDKMEDIYGMQISVSILAKTQDDAKALLKELGFPIKTQEK